MKQLKKLSSIHFCLLFLFIHSNTIASQSIFRTPARPTIAVIGTGYVGLVTGAGLAEFKNNVICADIDTKKISALQQGIIPIYEPGLKELVDHNVQAGRLIFSNDVAGAIKKSNIVMIAVGTPTASDGSADLSYVQSVVHTIAQNINGYKVICTKSTVPIGTGAMIRQLLEQQGVDADMFTIISNPEFLREGSAVHDFLQPDRLVIGSESEQGSSMMRTIYQLVIDNGVPFVDTNVSTSETIKYASNAFLAAKLSFINEIANICDATGADVHIVARAMGLDKRISPEFLKPGPGFGGSCFPKDSQALLNMGKHLKVNLPMVQASLDTNDAQKKKPAQKLLALFNNDIAGKKIAILGVAFKANTDDVRETPALATIQLLQEHGAIIKAYDPVAMEQMKILAPDIIYCQSLEDAVTNADAIILMTEWHEFKTMNLEKVAQLVKNRCIVDARNILDALELKRLGFVFDNIGRSYLAQ
ncbi:MAG: UDP-glucose/GDP-mannose dehydrogenase family protein [Candidatus Babeliales bacterium]|nr:UDP-glucose/GDP-mannose dehydrogenase family protein [Candidatus Babeliales bacterium]